MLIDAYIKPSIVTYGPAKVSLAAQVNGNPYDATLNDVRFVSASGTFPAYFDAGVWRANVVGAKKGKFSGQFTLNGKMIGKPISFTLTKPLMGYVQREGTTFSLSNGTPKPTPYWPIGHNLAWQGGKYSFREQMDLMKANGLNWTRIWACHWDNRNPYWPTSFPKPNDGMFSPEVLKRWDETVWNAEATGLKFQFVLFHHGQVSSDVNPNWNDHPWNAKNGGFLKSASEFFSHPEAIKREKNFIRYAIARWGVSPSIMAWELFNEVQFVDRARKDNDWATIAKWHDEMGRYIRSLDPYRHLVTTSSELGQPIWNEMDYLQGHAYPSSIHSLVAGTSPDPKKPLFYGEVGFGDGGQDERVAIRDGIWSALFAGHSGAAQYWYWDRMNGSGMYEQYATAAKALRQIGDPNTYKSVPFQIDTPMGAALEFIPGRGWEKTDKTRFNLPEEADEAGKLSGYIQGPSKPEMQKEPIYLSFTAKQAGEAVVDIAEISGQGAVVVMSLNGAEVFRKDFGAGAKGQEVRIPFSPGANTIALKSEAKDWFRVRKVAIPGIMPVSTAYVRSDGKNAIVRVRSSKTGAGCTVRSDTWNSGKFEARIFDLETGLEAIRPAAEINGALVLANLGRDVVVVLKRR